jgi:plastocyanin
LVGIGLLAALGSYEPAAAAPKVKLTISNFRYCTAESCSPLDTAYVRGGDGPVMGTDNPQAVIEVKRGSMVSWVYRDSFCDGTEGCPGHNVVFENGTPQGSRKGFAPARKGAKTINVKITQKKGTTIRYFCSVNSHYQYGMTGAIRVV